MSKPFLVLVALLLFAAYVIGVFLPRAPEPLSNASIATFANCNLENAFFTFPDGRQSQLDAEQGGELAKALRHLVPISGASPGELGSGDYEIIYQLGMDPTQIKILIRGDHLQFSVDDFVYTGGDSKSFLEKLGESGLAE